MCGVLQGSILRPWLFQVSPGQSNSNLNSQLTKEHKLGVIS